MNAQKAAAAAAAATSAHNGASPSLSAAGADGGVEELEPLVEPFTASQQQQPQHVLQVEQQGTPTVMHSSLLLEVWHAEHHDLVLPSDTAFRALLILPLMFWWLCVLAGMSLHQGTVRSSKVHHALLWYDRGLLRPFGPLLPFAVVLGRAGLLAALHWWDRRAAAWRGHTAATPAAVQQQQQQQQGPRLRLATLAKLCVQVYVGIALLRLAIYLLHVAVSRLLHYDIMSDHIFLSATMLVCLHVEMLCVLSDLLRLPIADDGSLPSLAELGLNSVFVTALFLYLLTALDMFFTARYYHDPLESALTLVSVFFLFQLPTLRWLASKRRPREVVAGVLVMEG